MCSAEWEHAPHVVGDVRAVVLYDADDPSRPGVSAFYFLFRLEGGVGFLCLFFFHLALVEGRVPMNGNDRLAGANA